MSRTYKCALCRGEFENTWTDDEALAEMREAFGPDAASQPYEAVCDDCYRMICPGGKPVSLS